MSNSIASSFLLFEIQFEFSIESFLETKLGNNPTIAPIFPGKFNFSLRFNNVLSLGLSLSFSSEYMMQKLPSSLSFGLLISGSVINSMLTALNLFYIPRILHLFKMQMYIQPCFIRVYILYQFFHLVQ